MERLILIFLFVIVGFSLLPAFSDSEQIFITISERMEDVIIDGKWSFSNQYTTEWKASSENLLNFEDGAKIALRSAHQDNFVYIMVDFISDRTIDKGADRALVCFDTTNNKSTHPDEDDYCFMAVQGRKLPYTFQGGSNLSTTRHLVKISNHPDFLAMAGVSGKYDRYSQTDHTSYEFKIPTSLIDRKNVYGFYVEVFDYSSMKSYVWPNDVIEGAKLNIKNPLQWGEMVSPDKSLPEFGTPSLVIVITFSIFLVFARFVPSLKKTLAQ